MLNAALKENAEALRENADALRRICELAANSGLPKIKMGGGKPKVLFDEGLKYVTGQEKRSVALARFRKFLGRGGFPCSSGNLRWPRRSAAGQELLSQGARPRLFSKSIQALDKHTI
jgi:hypothetical protein